MIVTDIAGRRAKVQQGTGSTPIEVLPPNDTDAEEAVLGSLLMDPDAIGKIASLLQPADFFREHNGSIYDAALSLHRRHEPIDFQTISSELRRQGRYDEIGGLAYLSQLVNVVPTAVHVESYAKRVKECSLRRRVISVAGRLAGTAYDETYHVNAVLANVARELQSLQEAQPSKADTEAPPLQHNVDNWPELDPRALYGLAGDVVRAIAPHTESSEVALLVNFLVAFGNAVGRGPHAVAEADQHPLNLFLVLVGQSAKGRKGSSWGHNSKLFAAVDPTWASDHIVNGLSSGEGLIWAVRDAMTKGAETIEAGVDDKRLFVQESEFPSVLKVMAREGNTLSPVIRLAWDTGNLRTLTKNSPAKATDAHISILGHTTQQELLRHLNDTEAGNGFANRFLWVCVRRAQYLPEGGGVPEFRSLVQRLREALDRARGLGQIRRDDAARAMWAEVYPDLSEGKPGLFGSVTARAEAQVLRLSALYAAIEGSPLIRPPHLLAALAVWQYAEDSARYIFGDALGDAVADRILEALRQKPDGLTRTEIHELLKRNAAVARIDQALWLLEECKRARREMRPTGGRSAEVWSLI